MTTPVAPAAAQPVLITGGAGFIGANLAHHLLSAGRAVRVLDDLSRTGVYRNLAWLRAQHGSQLDIRIADVRDRTAVRHAVRGTAAVFHLAGQTAIPPSLVEPRHDFTVNAGGTLEVLEAVRERPEPPPLVFASTYKVYGGLLDLKLRLDNSRWNPVDTSVNLHGIDERRQLELRTPHGCSKGAAEQYVLDYAHSFEIPAVVFRLGCIYGPHQIGSQDQGWIAHLLSCAIEDLPIRIYGDGHQVRDVLFIDDLVDALVRAWREIEQVRGRAFNIGGGPHSTLSLFDVLEMIEQLRGRRPKVVFAPPRDGDQRYYASNTRAFQVATGWRPRIAPSAGIEALHHWLVEHAASPSGPRHV